MRVSIRSPRVLVVVGAGALFLVAFVAAGAFAYERYNDGCQTCHGNFLGPTSPRGTVFPSNNKHEMHRAGSAMDTECSLCHIGGEFEPVFLGRSNGTQNNPGIGCNGCHGRDYGGNIGNSGVGLRAHHTVNNVNVCLNCHEGDPTPLPENVAPTYYGTPDTKVGDPCNSGPGFLENWSIGDTLGTDNDGDNDYDAADSDCGGGGCNGNEKVAKAKCKTKRGAVKKVTVTVKKATPNQQYTCVLDSGEEQVKSANLKGVAKFKFARNAAPPCGPNGATVCDLRKAFDCGC